MSKKHKFDLFDISLPLDWTCETNEEDVVTIYNEDNGLGALSISSYQIPEDYNFILFDELYDFATEFLSIEKDEFKKFQNTKLINEGILVDSLIYNERKWCFGIMFKNNKAILFTYNSEPNDYIKEINTIYNFINSINIY